MGQTIRRAALPRLLDHSFVSFPTYFPGRGNSNSYFSSPESPPGSSNPARCPQLPRVTTS